MRNLKIAPFVNLEGQVLTPRDFDFEIVFSVRGKVQGINIFQVNYGLFIKPKIQGLFSSLGIEISDIPTNDIDEHDWSWNELISYASSISGINLETFEKEIYPPIFLWTVNTTLEQIKDKLRYAKNYGSLSTTIVKGDIWCKYEGQTCRIRISPCLIDTPEITSAHTRKLLFHDLQHIEIFFNLLEEAKHHYLTQFTRFLEESIVKISPDKRERKIES